MKCLFQLGSSGRKCFRSLTTTHPSLLVPRTSCIMGSSSSLVRYSSNLSTTATKANFTTTTTTTTTTFVMSEVDTVVGGETVTVAPPSSVDRKDLLQKKYTKNSSSMQKKTMKNKNNNKRRNYQNNHTKHKSRGIPTTCWMDIPRLPRHSNLEDILVGIEAALEEEKKRGILDLDQLALSASSQDTTATTTTTTKISADDSSVHYWDWKEWQVTNNNNTTHMVLEARSMLDTHQRHKGWFLKFPNRSVVHALLEHDAHVRPIYCGSYPLQLVPHEKETYLTNRAQMLVLDDSVLRMDRVANDVTEEDILRLLECGESNDNNYNYNTRPLSFALQHYGPRPAVEEVLNPQHRHHNNSQRHGQNDRSFWIRLASASDARSVMRQFQGLTLGSQTVSLVQFPKQIIQ